MYSVYPSLPPQEALCAYLELVFSCSTDRRRSRVLAFPQKKYKRPTYNDQARETLALDLRGHGIPLIAPETTTFPQNDSRSDVPQQQAPLLAVSHDNNASSPLLLPRAAAQGSGGGGGGGRRLQIGSTGSGCSRRDAARSSVAKKQRRPSIKPGKARTVQDERIAVAAGQVCCVCVVY